MRVMKKAEMCVRSAARVSKWDVSVFMANHKRQLIHNITSANGLKVTIKGAFIEIVRFIR
jgi:hypothetical protein